MSCTYASVQGVGTLKLGVPDLGMAAEKEALVLSCGPGLKLMQRSSVLICYTDGIARMLTYNRANARWLTLTNALSGLFCASLNFIDATRTIRPVSTFEPDSRQSENATSSRDLQLLHGMLPNEVVCTENLTPFLKLLPCKGKAGISSLLDGHKLFDASWQTMSIDITRKCDGINGQCNVHVEQTVDMVLNLERAKRSKGELFDELQIQKLQ